MSTTLFIAVSIAFILIDVAVVVASLREHDREGYILSITITCAALVDIFYLLSVVVTDYFLMSTFSSAYFICVDLAIASLLAFLFSYCDLWHTTLCRVVMIIVTVVALVDITFLAINPTYEVALTYIYDEGSLAHWHYSSFAPYVGHLTFCYVMVAGSFVLLIGRCIMVPRVFRRRYLILVLGLVVIVAINAMFLFIPSNVTLDYSLVFYSFMAIYMYFAAFRDSARSTLAATHEMIIDELGRAVILFDFEGRYAVSNSDAEKFIAPEHRNRHYHLSDFLASMGLENVVTDPDADCSFRRRFMVEGELRPYRFDLRILHDQKQRELGRLVILVDGSLHTDLITGFHTKAMFEREFQEDGLIGKFPTTVCVCDLNHLADLNASAGREIGDEAIKALADAMTRCLPRDTFFARHDDANLVAVCEGMDLSSMQAALAEIAADVRRETFGDMRLEMQSAASVVTEDDPSIIKATNTAISALKMRKMLDFDSAHSSLLASLAMTQRQSDGETEEHVRRTRAVADRLGKRLGLSDWDQSSLALLCLLHDIGKVGVPLEILNKPTKLTDAEWEVLKSHTTKGYRIAAASEELSGIADGILHHHERWDGRGYPDGLARESIPLLSRILMVIDTYDAMTHDRPYRNALSREEALAELKRCAGAQFDPTVVAEFLAMMDEDMSFDPTLAVDSAYVEQPIEPGKAVETYVRRRVAEGEAGEEGRRDLFQGGADPDLSLRLDYVRFARYVLDDEQHVIETYDSFEDMTGYSAQDVKDYALTQGDLLFPEDVDEYWKLVADQLEKRKEAYLDHRLRCKDGSSLSVFCYGRLFYDSAARRERSEIVIADVTSASSVKNVMNRARVSALHNVQKLEDRASRDATTGLLNREAFRSEVQMRLFDNDCKVVLIMADVDKFKDYNDTYGHVEGDALLVHMAQALEQVVGDLGLVSRMGGDEFAAALYLPKDITAAAARNKVQLIWGSVSSSMRAFRAGAGISMGAAYLEGDEVTFQQLYGAADEELYRAKNAGRGRAYCSWDKSGE